MKNFDQKGYRIFRKFLKPSQCKRFLTQIQHYQNSHSLQHVYRKNSERSLDYFVIDGNAIRADLPVFWNLYARMNRFLNKICGIHLSALSDPRAAVNINVTAGGGEYRWHYDRNRVTALLYLNRVDGGEIEFYPNYRLKVAKDPTLKLQQIADLLLQQKWIRNVFGKKVVAKPAPGKLIVMRGDRCLHSVRRVTGGGQRINIVMAYDLPGRVFTNQGELDRYLYDEKDHAAGDPNYK
jgi:2-oxoglutarate-Fe(II)-dependent oxygenase superfamily protein